MIILCSFVNIKADSFTHLKQVATFVHLSDVFISEDAAGAFQLTLTLPCPSRDDGLMHTAHMTETSTI